MMTGGVAKIVLRQGKFSIRQNQGERATYLPGQKSITMTFPNLVEPHIPIYSIGTIRIVKNEIFSYVSGTRKRVSMLKQVCLLATSLFDM